MMSHHSIFVCAALCAVVASSPAVADDALADLSLEELLTLEVTSVAKKPQDPAEAPAAITVITQEDIRRSGASTLPEALRLAPGVEVAEIDGTITAVSVRGFNWRFSNKLLVLIDGRAIYQPTQSGVFWDQHQTPVEDIQRIEVVRGPGATMWGSNAVNGVINIVTKHAADTLNGQATLESDGDDRHRAYARYGLRLGDIGALRVYGHYRDIASLVDANGDAYNAGSQSLQLGFRADLEPTARDAFTIQGDHQSSDTEASTSFGALDVPFVDDTEAYEPESYNLLGRWVRTFSSENAATLQVYYDFMERSEFNSSTTVETFDVDFSHRFRPLARADLVWGLNYRRIDDAIDGGQGFTFDPPEATLEWTSGFVKTEVAAVPERLNVTVGVKLEDNPFTGFESQPSARFIWLGETDWSVWGAVSRAVRTPSRMETGITLPLVEIPGGDPLNPGPLPITFVLVGDPEFDVETLNAYELGFRKAWRGGANLDVAVYHQDYEDLLTASLPDPDFTLAPIGPGGALVPVAVIQDAILGNGSGGAISGVEFEVSAPVTDWWEITAFADYRDIDFPSAPFELGAVGAEQIVSLGDSPTWQASVRSDFTVAPQVDLSLTVRHVSELEFGSADAYTDLDLRASWRATDRLELTVLGENLLEPRRLEIFSPTYPAPPGFVERRVSLRAGLRF